MEVLDCVLSAVMSSGARAPPLFRHVVGGVLGGKSNHPYLVKVKMNEVVVDLLKFRRLTINNEEGCL